MPAIKAGLRFIDDIVNEEGVMSYQNVTNKFGHVLTWLDYEGLIRSIPQKIKIYIAEAKENQNMNLSDRFIWTKYRNKMVYKLLTNNDSNLLVRHEK